MDVWFSQHHLLDQFSFEPVVSINLSLDLKQGHGKYY